MNYRIGQRVAIAAWTDLFMRGERYGEVVKVGRKYVHVKGDRSGRTFRFVNCDPHGANPAIEVVA